MTQFLIQKETPQALKIWIAEATLAFHTVKHHFSFKSMDCAATLLRSILPDSEIAQKISCARTKTEAIVSNVWAPYAIEILVNDLKNIPYVSVSTDSTNHGNIKVFPIVVQYFDHTQDGTQVKLLDLQDTKNEKSETISELIVNVSTKYYLKNKITVLSADNTNTNFNGVARKGNENDFAHLKNKVNPELIGIGCPEHILNNGAHHGLDHFALFDIDSIIVKIFNFFSIHNFFVYTVRTNELKDFCEFCRDRI